MKTNLDKNEVDESKNPNSASIQRLVKLPILIYPPKHKIKKVGAPNRYLKKKKTRSIASEYLAQMKPRQNSIDQHSSGSWHTQCDEYKHGKRQTGPSLHQIRLQMPHSVADDRIIACVSSFLPIHPFAWKLAISLHHLHLVDPLAKNDHALVHQSPARVVVVGFPPHCTDP